jgi:hypothetical protein
MHYSVLGLLCALSVVAAAPIAGKSVEARQNRHVLLALKGIDDELKDLLSTVA